MRIADGDGGRAGSRPHLLRARWVGMVVLVLLACDGAVESGAPPEEDAGGSTGDPTDAATPTIDGGPGDADGGADGGGTTPDAGPPGPTFEGPQLFVATTGDDDNPGTEAEPFRTIQRGIDAAEPGVTVRVKPGVYAEQIYGRTSGTESARVRIVSEVRWGAKVRPSGVEEMIWRNSGEYVDIEGFEVDGSESPAARHGIYAHGSHVTVRNNYVHHVHDVATCTSQGASGIQAEGYWGDENIDVLSNLIHDVGPPACTFDHGVYHTGSGAIVNNVVYRASGCALHLWHDPRHNDILNNTVFSSGTGICLGGGDFYGTTDTPGDYIRVINNVIVDNEAGVWAGGTLGPNNAFENNLLFDNDTDWSLGRGSPTDTIEADPLFVDYRRDGGGDYRLQPGSPAVDTAAAADAPASDFIGWPRPRGDGPDIGAFESH